jgi:hypothetical protein
MTIQGLVTRIRTEFLDDAEGSVEANFLWKTAHIVSSLNQAERELCRRLYLLHDSTTVEICQISIVAVDGVFPRSYAMDDRILRIERLKFPGVTPPLIRKTTDWLDQHDSGWDEAKGTPSHYVVDADEHSITFNRQPETGGTVTMTVKRLPKLSIIEKNRSTDSPELKQLDDELIHGALKYLFSKPDLEGYDPSLSAKWGNQFETDIKQIEQNRAALNPQENICRAERF